MRKNPSVVPFIIYSPLFTTDRARLAKGLDKIPVPPDMRS